MAKIVVGLSGGVDSAVAAALLVAQGHDVHAVFMKNWTHAFAGICPWREDRRAALMVAAHLGIPLHTWDFEQEYSEYVMENFFSEYIAGRTPNPDILCNRYIKFDAFVRRARAAGADAIATGHYAKIVQRDGMNQLHIPRDREKDQTYFLCGISREVLSSVRFPLADMTKKEVREFARKRALPSADRPDSQGICFVGEIPVKAFLETRLNRKPGNIIDQEGNVLGRHDGVHFYTIGQRKGLQIAPNSMPHYVAEKDMRANTLTVVPGTHAPALFHRVLQAEQCNWFGDIPADGSRYHARIRYRQEPVRCTVQNAMATGVTVTFPEPQRAITPGQFLVLYDNTRLVGSGIITDTL